MLLVGSNPAHGKLVCAVALFLHKSRLPPSIFRSAESGVSIRIRLKLQSVSDSPLPVPSGYINHTSCAIRKGAATAARLSSTHPNFTPRSQYLSITPEGIRGKKRPWKKSTDFSPELWSHSC